MEYLLKFNLLSRVGNPTESGWYMAASENGYISHIPYSAVHGVWNAFDEDTEEEAKQHEIKSIAAWADASDLFPRLTIEIHKEQNHD